MWNQCCSLLAYHQLYKVSPTWQWRYDMTWRPETPATALPAWEQRKRESSRTSSIAGSTRRCLLESVELDSWAIHGRYACVHMWKHLIRDIFFLLILDLHITKITTAATKCMHSKDGHHTPHGLRWLELTERKKSALKPGVIFVLCTSCCSVIYISFVASHRSVGMGMHLRELLCRSWWTSSKSRANVHFVFEKHRRGVDDHVIGSWKRRKF